ncbi:MAG: T9SS type A sorting domain-containing protein [Bacteroidota bacterium]|nr:T9SS type A sorting domain-containing protein [Bacteroidota bacterium]
MRKIVRILLLIAFIFSGSSQMVAQWTHTGGPEGGYISAFTEDDLYFYATTPGPIYRMQKDGSTWNPLPAMGGNVESACSLAMIDTTLIAGTPGGGVYRSTDHGVTWDRWISGLDQAETVFSFAVNGNDLFAGTNRGVYLSTDQGANWSPANTGQDNLLVLSILIKDTNIFTGTMGGGMYHSSNYGTSWTQVSSDMIPDTSWVWSLALMDNTLFAGTWWGEGIYRSTDNGTIWTVANNGLDENPERDVNTLQVLGQDLYAGTHGGVFLTEDGGDNWTSPDPGLGSIVNCFHINGTDIYAGAFDGVHLSTNSGDNWTTINSGLTGTLINVVLRVDTTLFAGTQYNDLFRLDDNGANWIKTNLQAPNISSLVVSGTDLFVGTSNGVSRSTDGGDNWSLANSGIEGEWISSLAVIPSGTDSEYLFAGTDVNGVLLSIDKGTSWMLANSGLTDSSITCLAVIGTNLFAGTRSGMFLSQNYGTSWTPINTGLTDLSVQCLATSSGNLFAGTGSTVFLSANNGTSWTKVYNSLNDLNVLSLTASGTNIFAGTWFDAVFLSKNNGETWANVKTGMRDIPVLSLDLSATDIFAGTRGFGVWRRPLDELLVDLIAPELTVADDPLYQPDFIEVTSTEDGIIYLVPEYTYKDLTNIRGACLDSVVAVANSAADMPLSGLDNGIYWLYGRDSTGNISDYEAFTITGVGINKATADQLSLFPNPANNHITIQTMVPGEYLVEIFSMSGQIILSRNFRGISTRIDLSSLQKGVCFITVRSNDFVTTEKIIKIDF